MHARSSTRSTRSELQWTVGTNRFLSERRLTITPSLFPPPHKSLNPSMATNGSHSGEPSEYGREARQESLIKRSWHVMSDVLSPFSPSALAQLPQKTFRRRPRYTRTDNVPEAEQDEQGQMPTVRDYHAINSVPPQVRVPKKIATPIKVEGKVWFANERSA